MHHHPQTDGAMQGNRYGKGAVEQHPPDGSLGAGQDFIGRKAALNGIDHHRNMAERQRRHDQRGDPLQHVKADIQHQELPFLPKKDAVVARLSPAIAFIGFSSLGQ